MAGLLLNGNRWLQIVAINWLYKSDQINTC